MDYFQKYGNIDRYKSVLCEMSALSRQNYRYLWMIQRSEKFTCSFEFSLPYFLECEKPFIIPFRFNVGDLKVAKGLKE